MFDVVKRYYQRHHCDRRVILIAMGILISTGEFFPAQHRGAAGDDRARSRFLELGLIPPYRPADLVRLRVDLTRAYLTTG